ncbi:hypothetical protein OROGR_017077 [Orobanche gracilis]
MKSKHTPKPTYTHQNSHTHTETHTHRHPRLASARRPGIQTAKTQGVQQRVWRRRDDGFTEATIQKVFNFLEFFNLISIQVSGSFHFLCNLRFEDLNLVEVQVGFTVMAREGVVSDGFNALMRYYLNNFVDGTKQCAWFILPWDFLEWKGSNHSFELSRAVWDYSFQILYKVTLERNTLSTELKVTNTDPKPFSFTAALHTYFSVLASEVSVTGLKGCKTLNKDPDPRNPVEGEEERDAVTFPRFVDCIYLDAPGELQMDNGLDAILWNPHLTMGSCFKEFVCVENAKNEQDFEKDDAVGSEEPTERDHGVDLQQPLLIEIDSSDRHQK